MRGDPLEDQWDERGGPPYEVGRVGWVLMALVVMAIVGATSYVCRPRPVPVPPPTTLSPHPEPTPEPTPDPAPTPGPVVTVRPCEGLREDASLRCVLDSPVDSAAWSLLPFSERTLRKAEAAARRLRKEVS